MFHDWWERVSRRSSGEQLDARGVPSAHAWWNEDDSQWDPQAPDSVPLDQVRHEFEWALEDVRGAGADRMRWRIRRAHGRHELWYLRPEVFDLVARQHSQCTAQERLRALDRYFRQGHSGPVPL